MAFYLLGDYIRKQRERLGVTQEELCEGICSTGTLSKIENGRQGMRLSQYIALMQRLGLPIQQMNVQVTREEMEWYNLKKKIGYKVAAREYDIEELLVLLEQFDCGDDRLTEQYVTFVRAGIELQNGNYSDNVLDMLLKSIKCTYPDFDIENINSVKLMTFDEIMIIDNIAIILRKRENLIKAIMWGYFLKQYLEKGNIDYDEKAEVYPMILFNLSNWLIGCRRFVDAEDICATGIEYCDKHGKLNMFMELLFNRGITCAELGKLESSARFMTYAYVIAKSRGDEKRAAVIADTFGQYGISLIIE